MNKLKLKKIHEILSVIVLIITILIMGLFLFYILKENLNPPIWLFVIGIIVTTLWLLKIILLFKNINKNTNWTKVKEALFEFGLLTASTLLTYSLINFFEVNPIISASIISLFGAIFLQKYGGVITVGAFLGMTTYQFIYFDALIAILITNIIHYYLKPYFNGFGGKLGTTAFVGGVLTLLIFRQSFTPTINYNNVEFIYVSITAILAAVITFFINHKLKKGPIIAYSVISIIGAFLFSLFDYTKGLGLGGIVFGASFVGMSSKEILPNYIYLIIASIVFSMIAFITPSFGNLGGRFGTTSLISVLIVKLIDQCLISKIKKEKILKSV